MTRYELGAALEWGPDEVADWRAYAEEQARLRLDRRDRIVAELVVAEDALARGEDAGRVAARLMRTLAEAV